MTALASGLVTGADQGVRPVAPMHAARMAHSATTLRDGRVLVVGGFTDESLAEQSIEAYDPARRQFTPMPRLRMPRHSHTATLLPSGKVLVVGGYAAGGRVLASAEVFDPATGTVVPAASMREARAGHVAVLLADGTVLIAGGVGPDWRFLASAERYDPATGRFLPTGAMSVPRESHAAVRLRDGTVLVVGGHAGRRADMTLYTSAERYDPVAGVFLRSGPMAIRRHKHDAVLMADGRVLVSGGSDERDDRGAYRSTEVYDPDAGTFLRGPALLLPRYKHNGSSLLLPDGRILIAGGAPRAEVLDMRRLTSTLVPGGDALTGRFSAVAKAGASAVLITGGYGQDRGPQALAWEFTP